MRFSGTIYKDGKFWLAEIPILDFNASGAFCTQCRKIE